MTTFETISKHEREYSNNNFIQVARKVARDDHGETTFISVTRGYLDGNGSRRCKTNLTLPTNPEIVAWISDHLSQLTPLNGGS